MRALHVAEGGLYFERVRLSRAAHDTSPPSAGESLRASRACPHNTRTTDDAARRDDAGDDRLTCAHPRDVRGAR